VGALRSHDRRGVGRPRNGDTKPCPKCGKATCEFNDRYRFEGSIVPAWICDAPQCRYRDIVRAPSGTDKSDSRQMIAASKQVQAAARRAIMKSAARTDRARKRLDKRAKAPKPE
jgi:hypothetical protein